MKNGKLLVISLILLTAVLIGVTTIEPIAKALEWLAPFQPTIVITGFFVFLVAVSLFVYVIITNFSK
jgi:hypothetical protein